LREEKRRMRDVERIPYILSEIGELWRRYPDLRLGQLIGNVLEGPGLYYIEDEDLVRMLKKAYKEVEEEDK